MRGSVYLYIALALAGIALAFASSFLALNAGWSFLNAFLTASAVVLVVEVVATVALRRPLPWRALCAFVGLIPDLLFVHNAPPVVFLVMQGDAPAWVIPNVPFLIALDVVLVVVVHVLAWRFLAPKVAAQ